MYEKILEDPDLWHKGTFWQVPCSKDDVISYVSCRSFLALFDAWYQTGSFGLVDNPLFPHPPHTHFYRGAHPSLQLVACMVCNTEYPPRPKSHINEYPYCILNNFLTFERWRELSIPPQLPPLKRLYLLKARFANFVNAQYQVDDVFSRAVREPDHDLSEPHAENWPPNAKGLPMAFILDALMDEAYQLKKQTTFDIHKKYINKLVQQKVLPPDALTRAYPHISIL